MGNSGEREREGGRERVRETDSVCYRLRYPTACPRDPRQLWVCAFVWEWEKGQEREKEREREGEREGERGKGREGKRERETERERDRETEERGEYIASGKAK